jgi:hypothetical protein
LGLTVLTIGAAVLLVFRLTSQGLNLDEGFSAYLGRISAIDFVATVWNSEFNMVLHYALLRAWMHLGHSEFVIRSFRRTGGGDRPGGLPCGQASFSSEMDCALCITLVLNSTPPR